MVNSSLRRLILCAITLSLVITGQSFGAIITYEIGGALLPIGSKMPFGIPIPSGAAVTGRFSYDSTVGPIDVQSMIGATQVTTAWYLQSLPDGFLVDIAGEVFTADSYAITVVNDAPISSTNPTLFDTVSVIYTNSTNIPSPVRPTSPLEHEGTLLGSAQLLITLRAPASLLPNRDIPYPLVWSQFTSSRSLLLNDMVSPLELGTGSITTLTLVPEPSTTLLLASGILFAVVRRLKSRFSTTAA